MGITGICGSGGRGPPKRCLRKSSASSILRKEAARTAREVQITASHSCCGPARRSNQACMMPLVSVVWVMPAIEKAAGSWLCRRQHSAS